MLSQLFCSTIWQSCHLFLVNSFIPHFIREDILYMSGRQAAPHLYFLFECCFPQVIDYSPPRMVQQLYGSAKVADCEKFVNKKGIVYMAFLPF